MLVPFWTYGYRVDEAIECLPYEGDDVVAALMAANPDAYADDNHDEHGECIIEDRTEYRTSKTFERNSLAAIWTKLDPAIQDKLQAAYRKDYPGDE